MIQCGTALDIVSIYSETVAGNSLKPQLKFLSKFFFLFFKFLYCLCILADKKIHNSDSEGLKQTFKKMFFISHLSFAHGPCPSFPLPKDC